MQNHYTLYGSPISLYTAKARAYLINKGLEYEEVFSSLSVYKKIIIPQTGVRFIPVVKTPQGQYLQDTAVITDTLEIQHPDNPLLPKTAKQKLVSLLFELWADEWLVIPAMHYRWNKNNFPYLYQEFGRVVVPWAPNFVKEWAGKKLGAKFKGFVPMLGITQNSIAAIEHWYENTVLRLLNEHFSTYAYLLGSKPSTADCALMGPLYAHLYADPAPRKIMQRLAPNVCDWISRMQSSPDTAGDWLADDQVPDTLHTLLQNQADEFWPVIENTVNSVNAWVRQHPDKAFLPRSIGVHSFSMGSHTQERVILPFHQWKLQRLQSHMSVLCEDEKNSLHSWNGSFDANFSKRVQQFINIDISSPLVRQNNKLCFERK